MPSTPFGEHLKREREMRGVSLEEISAATRIGTRFLEALEQGRWEQLPGGAFNRGFIRSIARFLGLDEDSLVAEYDIEHGKEATGGTEISSAASRWPRRFWPIIGVVATIGVIVAIVVGGGFVFRRHNSRIAAHSRTQLASRSSTSAAPDATAAPKLAAGEQPKLQLRIQAASPLSAKVVADGKAVFEGRLAAGEVKQFDARDSFEISPSESSALILELNGHAIRPSAAPGRPGSIILTRADLKPVAGENH